MQDPKAIKMAAAPPPLLFYALPLNLGVTGTLRYSTGESVRDVLPARPHCEQGTNQQFQ